MSAFWGECPVSLCSWHHESWVAFSIVYHISVQAVNVPYVRVAYCQRWTAFSWKKGDHWISAKFKSLKELCYFGNSTSKRLLKHENYNIFPCVYDEIHGEVSHSGRQRNLTVAIWLVADLKTMKQWKPFSGKLQWTQLTAASHGRFPGTKFFTCESKIVIFLLCPVAQVAGSLNLVQENPGHVGDIRVVYRGGITLHSCAEAKYKTNLVARIRNLRFCRWNTNIPNEARTRARIAVFGFFLCKCILHVFSVFMWCVL